MKVSRRDIRKILIRESLSQSEKAKNANSHPPLQETDRIRRLVRDLLRERLIKRS